MTGPGCIHVAPPPAPVQLPDGTLVDNIASDVWDALIESVVDRDPDPAHITPEALADVLTVQLSAARYDGERWAVPAYTRVSEHGVMDVHLLAELDAALGWCVLLGVRN